MLNRYQEVQQTFVERVGEHFGTGSLFSLQWCCGSYSTTLCMAR